MLSFSLVSLKLIRPSSISINMLEVTRLDEEEAKPLMNVKEEQQPVE